MILGLDTSNYTTSAALWFPDSGQISQRKQLLPVRAGQLGLRQSDAVFHHVRQLPELIEALLRELTQPVEAIGVSVRPRNQDGSYMPCFLCGQGMAHSLAAALHCPVYETSHQIGHILAALYSAGRLDWLKREFLAFHVSGGTTDLLRCTPHPQQLLSVEQVGASLDLKAGQVIDRVGLMLGLEFPCGAALEQLARQAQGQLRPKAVLRGTSCCLSGLENQCRKLLDEGTDAARTALFCLQSIGITLQGMVEAAQAQLGALPVLYAGGVMSDQLIRPLLDKGVCAFAEPAFSADNAAGTALYGALMHRAGGSV